MRSAVRGVLCGVLLASLCTGVGHAQSESATRALFIGNSFIYGAGSPVRYLLPATVTDLNAEGIGGVPTLFKAFTVQAGLDYDVYLETRGGSGLDFHLENKRAELTSRPWDVVVMHGQSTLDFDNPRNPAKLVTTVRQMTELLQTTNPDVEIHLLSTWSRADQTYTPDGAWAGEPSGAMARDVRAGYDLAADGAPGVASVISVGEAWTRAMDAGVADPNPYDGIAFGQLNLWTWDHYHASAYGSYLQALVVFGRLTSRDPRSLGDGPARCAPPTCRLSAQV